MIYLNLPKKSEIFQIGKYRYKLFGVIHHIIANINHFVSYVFEENSWYLADDDKIFVTNEMNAFTESLTNDK